MHYMKNEILEALPLKIRELLRYVTDSRMKDIEEIRFRILKPLLLSLGKREYFLNVDGGLDRCIEKAYIVTKDDIENAFQFITDYSVYTLEEDIRNGFVTMKGGHRVGICGRVIRNGPYIRTIKDISGLNIRISKEKIGVSDHIMKNLIGPSHFCHNTLIISPPQCGKTTLLRDIVRNLSNGIPQLKVKGLKVGVVDERSEICGCYQGVPQNDVGMRTDILDACPKAEGMMMLIRSMSPEVIVTDEIGKKEDVSAIEEALHAGVKVITTVHGSSFHELLDRPHVSRLLESSVFEKYIILSNQPKVGTIKEIIDHKKIMQSTSNGRGWIHDDQVSG
ncbi:MAG: stage III sporulation protein AA [Bacillota bacterium]